MVSRHSNLSNVNSEPSKAPVEVTCTIHFDLYSGGSFPKSKFQDWLASLPEAAKIGFDGIANGKPHFTASWTETR